MKRFATHGEFRPTYNREYSYEVNKFGGLHKLVKTNIARNMWAVMKEFRVLPNDPLLKSLDIQALDFIIESMQEDNKEAERISKGQDPQASTEYRDDDFEEFWNDPHPDTVLAPGDDAEDIYRQVQEVTEDKNYDKELDNRIEQAISEHQQKDANVSAQIEENQKQLEKDMKSKGLNTEAMF